MEDRTERAWVVSVAVCVALMLSSGIASWAASATVDAPSAPAISLAKTVGTTSGTCATTSSVNVPAGTIVYYCFQATNTGTVAFAYHTLVDDQLGTILNTHPYALAPGALSDPVIVSQTITADVTNTATWTASDGISGYLISQPQYNWVSIETTGTALGLSDDEEANITSPFSFTLFGVTGTSLRVGNNGGILFNATAGDVTAVNSNIPATTPALAILPFWDDIDAETGDVYWEVLGTAPSRQLVVEWYNRPHYNNVRSVTFEAILFEGSNQIMFQYADVDFGNASFDFGVSATVGLNLDASSAVKFSYNQAVITNGTALLFTPVTLQTASAQATASVHVTHPNIDVTPLSLSSTQTVDTTASQTLTIGNTGDGDIHWTSTEEPVVVRPAAPSASAARRAPAEVGLSAPRFAAKPSAVIFQEGFESGAVPPSGWTAQVSDSGFTWGPLTTSPHSGTYFADVQYDSNLAQQDEWLLSPAFSNNPASVSFWSMGSVYWCRDTYNNCDLEVWLVVGATAGDADDIYVGTADGSWTANWTWAQSSFSLTPLLPAGPVRLGFRYHGLDGAEVGLDDVVLDGAVPLLCSSPQAVPWLSTSLTTGTVGPLATQPLSVTFDSTGLLPATYSANLCVHSDDPDPGPGNGTDLVIVPVTLTVYQPANVTGTKSVTGAFKPLGAITYTIVLSNAGPGAQSDNPGPELSDQLPATLTATGANATSGTAQLVGNLVTWNGAIPAGGSVTITVTATVNQVAAGTQISNQGTISYDSNNDGVNDATGLTDDPQVQGASDPTAFAVAAAETIPTLDWAGLSVLILVLGGAALLLLRRLS
jgi:hypothetical protein